MRVAYAVDGRMARGETGSGHHIRNFKRHLAELGVDVRCFDTLDGSELDPFDPHSSRRPIGSALRVFAKRAVPTKLRRRARSLGASRRARAHLRAVASFSSAAFEPLHRYRPDFLICRMSHGNTFAREALDNAGIPYGLECNAPILYQESRYGTLVDEDECRAREDRLLEAAQFIGYVSAATRRICEKRESYRTVPGQVIPNCVDTRLFAPDSDRERTRARLGFDESDTVAVYVGSFKPWHRPERLLDVVRALDADHVKFLLLGPGATVGPLANTLRRKHAGRVRLVENVPQDDVGFFLAAADIGIQLGANEYSAPLKLVEYMAVGLAIVAPRVPPIEELLTDGANALLVEDSPLAIARALATLDEQPALRTTLGRQALEDAHPYTWAWNARTYLELIETALARPREGAVSPSSRFSG